MVGGLRVHWATFDAEESNPKYNWGNCEMAARLLNANLREVIKRNGGDPTMPQVGFWCERGQYEEEGSVPSNFNAEFPTEG